MNGYYPYQQGIAGPHYGLSAAPYPPPQQQRLQALEQQLQSQYGQLPAAMPQMPSAAILPVQSEAEARAYQPDLSGATQFFVQKDGGKIYAKQFNTQTALVDFETYERATGAAPAAPQEVPPALFGVVSGFEAKLDALQGEIQKLREEIISGNKLHGGGKSSGKQKSANAANDSADSGDGAGGE